MVSVAFRSSFRYLCESLGVSDNEFPRYGMKFKVRSSVFLVSYHRRTGTFGLNAAPLAAPPPQARTSMSPTQLFFDLSAALCQDTKSEDTKNGCVGDYFSFLFFFLTKIHILY